MEWDSTIVDAESNGFLIMAGAVAPTEWKKYNEGLKHLDAMSEKEVIEAENRIGDIHRQRKRDIAVIFKHRLEDVYGDARPLVKSEITQIRYEFDTFQMSFHSKSMMDTIGELEDFFHLPGIDDVRSSTVLKHESQFAVEHVIFDKLIQDSERMQQKFRNKTKIGRKGREDSVIRRINELRLELFENWMASYERQLRLFRRKFYSEILSPDAIFKEEKRKISTTHRNNKKLLLTNLNSAMKTIQKSRGSTDSLRIIAVQESNSFLQLSENVFNVQFTLPSMTPPSYLMRFTKIDLPSSNEKIQMSAMRNAEFEMLQTDKLLLHAMMDNGETILFIRHDEYDPNGNVIDSNTKVYASSSRILRKEQKPLKVIKRIVHLVAYCEAQKLLAILAEDRLVFCIYQEGGWLSTSNKRCDLPGMRFKAMLIGESAWVWLIDEHNIVRAFDYDAESWDTAKQFDLEQDFESYQLTPMGYFLIALKPQNPVRVPDTMIGCRKPTDQSQVIFSQYHNPKNINEDEEDVKRAENPAGHILKKDHGNDHGQDSEILKIYKRPLHQSNNENRSNLQRNSGGNELSGVNEKHEHEEEIKMPNGRIELHVFHLAKKKKLEYKEEAKRTTCGQWITCYFPRTFVRSMIMYPVRACS